MSAKREEGEQYNVTAPTQPVASQIYTSKKTFAWRGAVARGADEEAVAIKEDAEVLAAPPPPLLLPLSLAPAGLAPLTASTTHVISTSASGRKASGGAGGGMRLAIGSGISSPAAPSPSPARCRFRRPPPFSIDGTVSRGKTSDQKLVVVASPPLLLPPLPLPQLAAEIRR